MTGEEFTELRESAARLERAGDYTSARDVFLVVGDAAEEMGHMVYAREVRRRAAQNHVTAWARQRWPREGIHVSNVVITGFPPRRRSRIDLTVRRRNASRWEQVSVGRRGDVRLEREGA